MAKNENQLTEYPLFQYARNIGIEDFSKWMEKPIYRIMPIEYVLHIFEKKELSFSNICKYWEDPYELFIFKQNYTENGQRIDNKNILQYHFGQCWSTRMNSDALWRIYSPDLKGVRLKTTMGSLLKQLFANKQDYYVINFGPVKYFKNQDIEKWLTTDFKGQFEGQYLIDSFFMKRDNFSHEKEVRFIITMPTTDGNNPIPAKDRIRIKIDPNSVIQQIAFDPRLSVERCKILKRMLQRYDYQNIQYVKSSIYTMKPLGIEVSRELK